MTDHDDRLKRRYREIATEEPSAVIDAAILARARAARPRRSSWMVPVSLAAVLVLGIGVALRIQLEQPGIETSDPLRERPPPASEYSLPSAAEPAAPPPAAAPDAAPPASPAKPAATKSLGDAPRPQTGASGFTPSPPPAAERQRPAAPPASPPSAPPLPVSPPPQSNAPEPARVPEPSMRAQEAPAVGRIQQAPAAAAPLRAKREDAAGDAPGARELRKSVAAETDPARELERIARLREAGQHADADAALAEFRKRHPDYQIPDAMLERVKAR